MIKVVSFDIGGTLIENNENQNETKKYDLKSLTTLLNLPYEKVRETYKLFFQKSKGNFDYLVKKFCDELNILQTKEINNFFKEKFYISEDNSKVSDNNIKLLQNIKKQGYKIILFSNNCCLLNAKLPDELLNIIDDVFYSYDLGFTKNEKESYKYIGNKLGYKPSEFLHIGDTLSSDYLIPIQNGWNALYYGNTEDNNIKSITNLTEILDYLK